MCWGIKVDEAHTGLRSHQQPSGVLQGVTLKRGLVGRNSAELELLRIELGDQVPGEPPHEAGISVSDVG